MKRIKLLGIAVATVCALTALPVAARADDVAPGLDYFQTPGGGATWFNFGPGIGVVPLRGKAIDPGTLYSADTIVERKEVAVLPSLGSADTINIEMLALSLQSIDPVWVSGFGSFFDVFVTLDMGPDHIPATGDETPSLGQMTISHEVFWPDDGTNLAEGTFTSFFDVFADALFVPVGQTDPAFIGDVQLALVSASAAAWTHTHDGVPPLPGSSNFFLAEIPGPGGYPLGVIDEYEAAAGWHRAIGVPEPSSLLLLGLGGLAIARRRRS